MGDRLVWIRYAGDTRIRVAYANIDLTNQDLVIVRDDEGVKRAARIVGTPGAKDRPQPPRVTVEQRIVVEPGGKAPVARFLDGEVAPFVTGPHRWGAMGLPFGPDTPVTTAQAAHDVDLALASAGYREVQESRFHQIVPGDTVSIDGRALTVAAIDRRQNEIELMTDPDGEIMTIALDEFVRRESRE